MKKIKSYLTLLAITQIFLWPFQSFAQLFPLSENSWSNPEFVKRYMGSYGVDTELSPEITEVESVILQDLSTFIEEDVMSGINFLLPKITDTSSPALDFMMGQMYLQNGDNADAIKYYSKAIIKFPSFLRAYKNISLAYMQNNDCDAAMPYLNKVLDMGRADGLIYGFLGYCNLSREKYSAALSAYSIARLYQPDSRDWKTGAAQASYQAGQYQAAIILLDELIEQSGPDATYLMLQANSHLALDNYDSAIADLEILGRSNKATGASQMLLGDLYMQKEIPDLAIRSYLSALETNSRPDFNRASKAFDYLTKIENWTDADSYLAKLTGIYKDKLNEQENISLMVMQAQINQGKDNYSDASKTLSTVIAKDPTNGKALLLMARNYRHSGNYEQAEFYYDRAKSSSDFAYEALTENARMAVDFRKYSRALNLLERAYEINPSSELKTNIDILQNSIMSQFGNRSL